MDWTRALFQVIDMRSFSSIWYWMVVAVVWSSVSHWVLGIPYDLIQKARKFGGEDEQDLNDLVRINVKRLMSISEVAGSILTAFVFFLLTTLFFLGFIYGLEWSQAVFLLACPLSIVGALSLNAARNIWQIEPTGEDLHARLYSHRVHTQLVGMVSVFVTAMWGMYQNLDIVRHL